MEQVPKYLWYIIFADLDPLKDFSKVSLVCKKWNEYLKAEAVWRLVVQNKQSELINEGILFVKEPLPADLISIKGLFYELNIKRGNYLPNELPFCLNKYSFRKFACEIGQDYRIDLDFSDAAICLLQEASEITLVSYFKQQKEAQELKEEDFLIKLNPPKKVYFNETESYSSLFEEIEEKDDDKDGDWNQNEDGKVLTEKEKQEEQELEYHVSEDETEANWNCDDHEPESDVSYGPSYFTVKNRKDKKFWKLYNDGEKIPEEFDKEEVPEDCILDTQLFYESDFPKEDLFLFIETLFDQSLNDETKICYPVLLAEHCPKSLGDFVEYYSKKKKRAQLSKWLDLKNENGENVLFYLTEDFRVIAFFAEERKDMNLKNNDGETPLIYYTINGDEQVVRCLKDYFEQIDCFATDSFGFTALEISKKLYKNGSSIIGYLELLETKVKEHLSYLDKNQISEPLNEAKIEKEPVNNDKKRKQSEEKETEPSQKKQKSTK